MYSYALTWRAVVDAGANDSATVGASADIYVNGDHIRTLSYTNSPYLGDAMAFDYFEVNEGDNVSVQLSSLNSNGYAVLYVYNHIGALIFDIYLYGGQSISTNPITVTRPELMQIISPNGNEIMVGGTTQIAHITPIAVPRFWWYGSGELEYTEYLWGLYLSTDNGSSWEYLNSVSGNSDFAFINIPDISSDQCLLKISLQSYPGYTVYSDNLFSISNSLDTPKIVLFTPNDNDICLKQGTTVPITWFRNIASAVNIDLTTDGGQTWSQIASGVNADSFEWVVPDSVTSNARIRVQSAEDPNVVDYSDHPFQIYHLDLLVPNGGEIWMAGSTRMISWDNPMNCPLELFISFDGGYNWSSVTNLSGIQGVYYYTVPSVNSNQCKMKIQSTSNNAYYDVSDGVFTISTSPNLPKVVLTYPSVQNIHLEVGQIVDLSWTRQNVTEVDLEFSADNGVSWTEIISGLDANSFSWQVLDSPGFNSRIRVKASLDPGVSDVSDNPFSISKIQLLSPQGGEILTSDYSTGYSLPITWTAAGMTNVKIEYSSNGGASWTSISNSYNAAAEVYNWRLPGTPSNGYKIRVSNAANSAINRVSESFTLRNPIKLTNANGGGFVTNGSLFTIKWQNQDVNPDWSIWWEYSFNNSTWTRIYSNATTINAQQLTWFVTSGLGNFVWLRAVETSGNRIIGKSEGSFVVTDKSLILWSPVGGEEYNALSTQTITWEAQGCTNLNISLSKDNGVSWTSIATNIPSSQLSYQWLVPDTPSVNCRIRLSDTSFAYMNLIDDACFSIMPLQIVAPTVDFSADILSGDIPLAVQFTEEVNPGVGNIASKLWDFGDGNTSDQTNPLHTYTVAGSYTVSLTVTNDFEGTATETKTDYITALSNTPRIELLSASSLNYGVVYLGDTSPAQTIEVKNIGSAPMIISSVSYYLANSQFALSGTELPITVPVNETTQLSVVFIPVTSGAVSDSIYIHSDSSNIPSLAVKLSAVGEYVPPAMVEGLVVSVIGNYKLTPKAASCDTRGKWG